MIAAILRLGARVCAWASFVLCRASCKLFMVHSSLLMRAFERDSGSQKYLFEELDIDQDEDNR